MDRQSPKDKVLLGLGKDWAVIPYLVFILIGFAVSLFDIILTRQYRFQLTLYVIVSIPFLLMGGIMRVISRTTLKKAGLDMLESTRLRIVDDQKLITTGVYKYIRHPLYLGEICRNIGVPLFFHSLLGLAFVLLGTLFLLVRIDIEEEMLVEEFGEEYVEYRKGTKKVIPFVY